MYSKQDQRSFFELSKALLVGKSTIAPAELIAQLRQVIVYHEWRYYVLNDPIISDFEYDSLFKQLEALEAQHPHLLTADSPTQRVSSDLTSDFESVEHLTPMLSLNNSYNAEDLKEFDTQIKKVALLDEEAAIEYIVEPKFDGGSIALVYENDRLIRGATRGNGTKGDDITNNTRTMRSIPLVADFSKHGIHKIELRGEVVIRKNVFERLNEKRAAAGLSLLANPRNSAAGGLRSKDPKDAAARGLEAFVYQVGFAQDQAGNNVLKQLETHNESIELLGNLGFKIPAKEKKVCKNIEEVIEFCQAWEQKREQYPYEVDGMVVKVNNRELQEAVGYTSHHPRWAIAFKFKAKQATTKLLHIEYQVGKIGSITPVAKLEPVQLAGVTVSSVSLHNEDFIKSKDLHIGDTVLVERAGDVIPYIVKAMDDLRDGSEVLAEFPKHCPINLPHEAVQLVRVEGEAAWRCPNCICGAQDLQRMIFHVSKPAMNIDGMGQSYVERFYAEGWLKNIADIYNLDYEKIAELEGFGERSAAKLKLAIDKAKQNPIHRLLHSLSVHHLGKKVSKLIAAEIQHVLDLQKWTLEDFTNIKDVGPVVSQNVIDFFKKTANIELLQQMETYGVNLTQTEEDRPKALATDAPLSGKTILFTGKLSLLSRTAAKEKATTAGARNISAVSSKLDILVVGEKAGSKLKKAQALGTVQIITEAEFVALVS